MAKSKDEELGDDFSYILRMADTDMDGLKPLSSALTSVKGIGVRSAVQICNTTGSASLTSDLFLKFFLVDITAPSASSVSV